MAHQTRKRRRPTYRIDRERSAWSRVSRVQARRTLRALRARLRRAGP